MGEIVQQQENKIGEKSKKNQWIVSIIGIIIFFSGPLFVIFFDNNSGFEAIGLVVFTPIAGIIFLLIASLVLKRPK